MTSTPSQSVPRTPRNTPRNTPFPTPAGTPRNNIAPTATFARPDNGNPVPSPLAERDGTGFPAGVPSGCVPTKWNTRNGGTRNSITTTTRKAREGTCPSCGSTVLAGLDADVMGTGVVIDPDPITPARELTEWAAGRRTYTYTPTRREIDYRDAGSLTPRPNVHPTHTCPKEDPLW